MNDRVSGWRQRFSNLTDQARKGLATGVETAKSQWEKVDLEQVQARIEQIGEGLNPVDWNGLGERAQKLWERYGGLDGLLGQVRERGEAGLEELRHALQDLSVDSIAASLDATVDRWTREHGPKLTLRRLKALEAKLGAAQTVGEAHGQRVKATPAYQGKPPPVDAKLLGALQQIRTAVEARLADSASHLDLYALTSDASEKLWSKAGDLLGKLSSKEGKLMERLGQVRRDLGQKLEQVSPQWLNETYVAAQGALAQATEHAEAVLAGLDGVESVASDRSLVFDRFMAAMDSGRMIVDPSADAVSVGFLKEAAAGATGARGKELVYIKGTGELRVVDLELSGARIGVGGSARPYARSIYGDADAIRSTQRRHAGEVGALVFHAGAGWSDAGEDGQRVRSWHGTLGLGFHASLPLLGDQSVYSIRESTLEIHRLDPKQVAAIEAMLASVPAESRKWTGFVRDAVGIKPEPSA